MKHGVSDRVSILGVLAIDVYIFILVCDYRVVCRLHNMYIDVAYTTRVGIRVMTI